MTKEPRPLPGFSVITALSTITLATGMGVTTAGAAGAATAAESAATYQVGPTTDVSTSGGQNPRGKAGG